MRSRAAVWLLAFAMAWSVGWGTTQAYAAREAKSMEGGVESAEYQANRLFKRAEELLSAGEEERGVKMMETILDQFPGHGVRFKVHLALGKHYFDIHDQNKAIEHLRILETMKKGDEELTGEDREMYIEALYVTGVSYFQMRQYNKAFASLRKITSRYPNTVWANQAYYYIGMSHFAQEHWDKAIKALSLVGTFIDPDSPLLEFVEAGHRFHVKITDKDLPLMLQMGKEISASVETKGGDSEVIVCQPLVGQPEIFVGSILTHPGVAKPKTNGLEVVGGDTISVTYLDDNTDDGTKDVPRKKTVKVVSSAALTFTMGTYEDRAVGAFIGQPVFLKLKDLDLDTSDAADAAAVRIVARHRVEGKEEEASTPTLVVDIDKLLSEDTNKLYEVRDDVTVQLRERGDNPVHSGVFLGSVDIRQAMEGQSADPRDGVLSCAIGDEVVATYLDEKHVSGEVPREITATLGVSGEIDSRPRAAQDIVPDPIIRAKKELVEAEAYLELARIFKSMGLSKTAAVKSEEGLDKVKFTMSGETTTLPSSLKEQAFKLMWELQLAKDDLQNAMATCEVFNRLYPDSPLVSDALMGIARVFQERGETENAMTVLRRILRLPASFAKAEAQYRIGEIVEQGCVAAALKAMASTKGGEVDPSKAGICEAAVKEYKQCAELYPSSEYAGSSLGKVVDFHIQTKDYAVADDLLEQVFLDYQDEDFLDSMLLKWVIVAYRMGNMDKARDKCSQLIFEYPGSRYAQKAKATLQKIDAKLGKGTGTTEGTESKDDET